MDLFYDQKNCTKIKILNTRVCNYDNKDAIFPGKGIFVGSFGSNRLLSILEINI